MTTIAKTLAQTNRRADARKHGRGWTEVSGRTEANNFKKSKKSEQKQRGPKRPHHAEHDADGSDGRVLAAVAVEPVIGVQVADIALKADVVVFAQEARHDEPRRASHDVPRRATTCHDCAASRNLRDGGKWLGQ